jgi:hypothetical protein
MNNQSLHLQRTSCFHHTKTSVLEAKKCEIREFQSIQIQFKINITIFHLNKMHIEIPLVQTMGFWDLQLLQIKTNMLCSSSQQVKYLSTSLIVSIAIQKKES